MSGSFYEKTAKGAVFNYSSTIFVTILQFFTSIILVRLLTVSNYGVYSIVMGGVGVLGLIFPFATLQRFLPQYFQEGNFILAKKLVKAFAFYTLVAGAIFALAVFLFSVSQFSAMLSGLGIRQEYLWFFALISVLTVFTGFFDTVMIALIEQKFRSLARIIYSFLILALSFYLLSNGLALNGAFLSVLLPTLVLLAATGFFAYRAVFSRPSAGKTGLDKKALWSYSLISIFNYFGDIVLGLTIDIWIIGFFLGAYQAGLYAFASKTAQYLILLSPTAIASIVVFPMIVRKFTETRSKEQLSYFFRLYCKFIAFFVFPMIAGLVLLAVPIIGFVFSSEYLAVSGIFIISAIGFGFSAFRSATFAVYSTLEKPEIGLKAKLFFIYNLVADLILVPLYGLTGAIFATTSATLFVFITEFLLTRKHVQLGFPKLSFLRILINALLMGALIWLLLPFIKGTLTLGIAAVAGIAVYFALSFINRPFSARDAGFFEKLGIVGKFFSFFSRKNH